MHQLTFAIGDSTEIFQGIPSFMRESACVPPTNGLIAIVERVIFLNWHKLRKPGNIFQRAKLGGSVNRQESCATCDSPLSSDFAVRPSAYRFCQSADCQSVALHQSKMPSRAFDRYVALHRLSILEQRRFEAESRALRERQLQANEAENETIRKAFVRSTDDLQDHEVDLLPTPSGSAVLVPKDPARVERFRKHLESLVQQASRYRCLADIPIEKRRKHSLQETEARLRKRSDLRVISNSICGLCRGSCCSSGADTAHLSIDSIRKFMDSHPDHSNDQVIDYFLAHVPRASIEDGCILQGEQGCTLKREHRPTLCNGHTCDALKQWQESAIGKGRRTVVAIQRDNHDWWNRLDMNKSNTITQVTIVDPDHVSIVDLETDQRFSHPET